MDRDFIIRVLLEGRDNLSDLMEKAFDRIDRGSQKSRQHLGAFQTAARDAGNELGNMGAGADDFERDMDRVSRATRRADQDLRQLPIRLRGLKTAFALKFAQPLI